MYAVIKTGGKQYKVATGDVVKIEKIAGEEGKEVIFNEEVEDRLYRYNYQSIFDIMDLQKKMKQYMKK